MYFEKYIARSYHEGSLVPCKFVPHHGVAYLAWGGKEHAKTQYEVLVQDGPDNLVSVPASGGELGIKRGGEEWASWDSRTPVCWAGSDKCYLVWGR